MDTYVKFWGTRGSIPTPGDLTRKYGGNTSCVEVRIGGTLFVFDAGSGLRELGADLLGRGPGPLAVHLLLSHCHWDHVQGFPFFAPLYVPGNELFLYEHEGDDRFHRLLSGQMKAEYFPVDFTDLHAVIRRAQLDAGRKQIGDIRVESCELNHPGGARAYALLADGRKIVYATDNELPFDPADPSAHRPAPAALVEFIRDADLLITDAQYTDEQYLARRGWGHSSCLTVTDLAVQGGVKKLALFHHEPTNSDSDIDVMVETCRARAARQTSELQVFAAREGVELKLG